MKQGSFPSTEWPSTKVVFQVELHIGGEKRALQVKPRTTHCGLIGKSVHSKQTNRAVFEQGFQAWKMWGPFQISVVEFAAGTNVLPESQWSLGEKSLQMESTSQISKRSTSPQKKNPTGQNKAKDTFPGGSPSTVDVKRNFSASRPLNVTIISSAGNDFDVI